MYIRPYTFRHFNTYENSVNVQNHTGIKTDEPYEFVDEFCKTFKLPDEKRNHSDFDENLVQKIASYKDSAIKPVTDMLQKAESEKDITAGLFLLNRIIDAGAKNAGASYHLISRFNYSDSPNVQTMLSGVYRKTQVPDAFGPLMTMFLKNAQNPKTHPFDPNEEIGGAILEYLRNTTAAVNYQAYSIE